MQLDNTKGGRSSLSNQENSRLNSSLQEANSRAEAANFEVKQQKEQIKQVEERLNSNKKLIAQDQLILEQISKRNIKAVSQAKKSLEIEKTLLAQIEPLVDEGALGEYQVQKQKTTSQRPL